MWAGLYLRNANATDDSVRSLLADRAAKSKGVDSVSTSLSFNRLCGNLDARRRRSGHCDQLLLDFVVHAAVQHTFNDRAGFIFTALRTCVSAA